jgi:hypothetical protein
MYSSFRLSFIMRRFNCQKKRLKEFPVYSDVKFNSNLLTGFRETPQCFLACYTWTRVAKVTGTVL